MKLVLAVFQFIFGCRHGHLSRVFTIKHRTYRVCFDCSREFDLQVRLPDGEILPSSIAENVARHQQYGWRGEENPMSNSRHSDPANKATASC
jgi:hypothetical protein